ncbi:cell wall metabolism sensor histidine kinase WalK [Metabacillus fastidiosus]|uniref:cell wall metabolism sensor histidine kinase WalK n=1 Tax=Metabacillus fastidiosus TaxID=1458 RepID=UPI002DBE2ED8|nr:cell wall metabolism sensor histidine kinase WalK [Metabacillus fastidiosus]MEC2075626.1 cell wall metabolism sensor histidine kinase WalK [Metabacillus fastidiosus]
MNKVNFFRSLHFKFVLIYVLLILIAMQVMGVYFVRELEKSLNENFEQSLRQRINVLAYSIEQEMMKEDKERTAEQLQEDISTILSDNHTGEIDELRVINKSQIFIGTSNPDKDILGKKSTEVMVQRALIGQEYKNSYIYEDGHRVLVMTFPITKDFSDETIGAIYVVASLEEVFSQMSIINKILATGTVISLIITAALGIFLARTITRPMSDMRKQAIELAKGNFSRKVNVYGDDEIGQLAETFNNLTEKLEEAQGMTEGERRKLASVIAHMTDGVIATNRNGEVILINNPAVTMMNVSRETLKNIKITELLGIEEEYTLEGLFDEQEDLILDFSTEEVPYILKVSFTAIQREKGKIDGLIIVIYDVTEQEKIDQERREFVANVSHELRTPLTTMRSYLEALEEGAWEDKELAPQFLKVTQNETERMIRLVNDLLRLSKMDSKDYNVKKRSVNFTDFLNTVVDRFEMTKSEHITFFRRIPNEDLYVDIDTDKITQVLDNIISNAIKYSPEGGQIHFQVDILTDELQIRVRDQGVGIPKESIYKIFDRFYRVDKARTRRLGGTGLGLAIAKEMVTAHGGDIWAESKEGKGTTIFFTLPYNPEQKDEWK